MTPSARLAGAIDILTSIANDRRPAADVLKSWGQAHRFAGSGDRAAIAGLVYDALRRRSSSAFVMGDDSPRAVALGMLRRERGLDLEVIDRLADGSNYGPARLSDAERASLEKASIDGASPSVAGDYPEWLDPYLERAFGADRAAEGAALASRAPLDLRVNTLKADADTARAELSDLLAQPARWSPLGLRIAMTADAKSPAIHAEPAFIKGHVEVQDEGSQLAALMSGARPGEQVLDLCAGAGGKTLALAAMMENKGQLYATDSDKRRLAPIHDRLARSGARNVQVRTPKSIGNELDDLKGRLDLVVIDAPCTGIGAWRRNPDAKWRMRPGALEIRRQEQAGVLDKAVALLNERGRIAYITCSVLREENDDQVAAFLARHAGFVTRPPAEVAATVGAHADEFLKSARVGAHGLLMTPRTTNTDGFFVSVLTRGNAA